MDMVLEDNGWVTASEKELDSLSLHDKKSRLILMLSHSLDSSVHSVVELTERKVAAVRGGLCGLGALYRALADTLFTPSQLRAMEYQTLREAIEELSGKDSNRLSDRDLLLKLHDCKS